MNAILIKPTRYSPRNEDKRHGKGGVIFISGTDDRKLRAFEKSTGKLLWQTTLPALANATACTYMVKGKQYVALSIVGTNENPAGSIMAFSLP